MQEVASVSDCHSPSNPQQRVGCVGGGFVLAWRIVKCHPEGSQVRSSNPEVFVDGSQDDQNVGRHAILAANVEDDLPGTLPATSGQVRALYEEEGWSISPVDSIRRPPMSSDRERVHTTQFDMTAGDTVSEIVPKGCNPRCFCGISRSLREFWRLLLFRPHRGGNLPKKIWRSGSECSLRQVGAVGDRQRGV